MTRSMQLAKPPAATITRLQRASRPLMKLVARAIITARQNITVTTMKPMRALPPLSIPKAAP